MIPDTAGFLAEDFEITQQPSRTYHLDREAGVVRGFCDGLEAMRQTVFRILNTERYQYLIYSWNYGIETRDLYGQPLTYVCPELERRIAEALSMDARIVGVTEFEHDTSKKGIVHTTFTVRTIYGDLREQKEVKLYV